MNVFVLKPKPENLNKNIWGRSGYKSQVIVRAENEAQARQYVADYLDPKTDTNVTTSKSPWLDENITECNIFQGDLYPASGDPGILYPAAFRGA